MRNIHVFAVSGGAPPLFEFSGSATDYLHCLLDNNDDADATQNIIVKEIRILYFSNCRSF
jgi:hypothetical protein